MNHSSFNGDSSKSSGRQIVILTEGYSDPITAKTASSILRYRPNDVVALLDSSVAGKTTQEVLGVGNSTKFIASLEEASQADTLMLGIAPPGGRIPEAWKRIILQAIDRGMDVVSGLHDFLSNYPEFARAATEKGVKLFDIRMNSEHDVANRVGINNNCLRIHTVGQDCSLGKMLVALELTQAMQREGTKAKFVATGQTGIMIEGDGCPVDCVVSDFISGAVEKLILANQNDYEVLFIEGQGSLAHPRYSAVTLGLLHGCMPHGMIMCYEVGRKAVHGMEPIPLQQLSKLVEVYESMANLMGPSKVIGVAMNSRYVSTGEAEAERERVRSELGLPVCDVIRHGPDDLLQAVRAMMPEMVTS